MRWAVVFAGGNGSRLQSLTKLLTGDDRPKQFCPLVGGETLLSQTRSRIALNVNPARSLFVVTRDHERYYRRELADVGPSQLIEQPVNRGTAAAIAYSVARVRREDPKATLGFFPADHYYDDAEGFRRAVDLAYRAATQRPDLVFLLGTEPDSPEVEYGWIEPGVPLGGASGHLFSVARFWEKPPRDAAIALLDRGCLWNMFVMVGSVGAFQTLLDAASPDLGSAFDRGVQAPGTEADAIARVYASIPSLDFSQDVLASRTEQIGVIRVPSVGWTDLGQPARVRNFLRARGSSVPSLSVAS